MNKEECRRTESLEVLFCFVIGNCCNVVVVRQEFRKKFLPKCVRWHALFLFVINFVDNMDKLNYAIYMEHELVSTIFLMTRRK